MPLSANKVKKNELINAELKTLYEEHTQKFLTAWSEAFGEMDPGRINEFGIIDTKRYDPENGILFIGRETNGWSDEDYANGCLFRGWLCDISRNGIKGHGHISRHPNMWYNLGRWILLLQNPETPLEVLSNLKAEAIDALGTIAFTNINKVRGKKRVGKEYYALANTDIAKKMIQQEIRILRPKTIVACGTKWPVESLLSDGDCKLICMNHPGARKSSRVMLQELKAQI